MKGFLALYGGIGLAVFIWQAASEGVVGICRYNDDRCLGSMIHCSRNAAIWPVFVTDLLLPPSPARLH